ncbi:MAG: M1 family aminopeptidase, partial [Thermomicrobiales bacterium]
YAAQAIALFNELLVPYPYATFDVVPVELYGAAGVEFPQLIFIAQSYYVPDPDLAIPNDFDFTIAHEVVHQWFYALVGNNQYLHAFTDEGLTNFLSSRVYFSHEYGGAVGGRMFDDAAQGVFVSVVRAGGDQIVDTPTDAFDTSYAYAWAAYAKAPVGFNAIYTQVGEDAFLRGLRDYINAFAFHVAQPDNMMKALSGAAGEDIGPLWRHWFNEKNGEQDIAAMEHPSLARRHR